MCYTESRLRRSPDLRLALQRAQIIMDAATTERALDLTSNYPVHARALQLGGLGGIEIFTPFTETGRKSTLQWTAANRIASGNIG